MGRDGRYAKGAARKVISVTQPLNLGPRTWLVDPKTQTLVAALQAHKPGCLKFVGGCVRNSLLQQPVDDIDIATSLPPFEVVRILEAAGIKVVPTGIDHGTVTAIVSGKPFEITTLRRDVETDGRHAVVEYTDDWAVDASRRDFRLNAIYAAPDGTLLDPCGGIADARAGRVIFIGDPEARIIEDTLRILRFFRFNAWYGRSELDSDGLRACAALKSGIEGLAAERVWKELKKLLAAFDPRRAMRAMAASGVLPLILPETKGLEAFDLLVETETSLALEIDPLVRLMALIPRDGAVALALAARLRLSNAERDRLEAWATDATVLVSYMSARDVRRALYRMGREVFTDRTKLEWATCTNTRQAPQWRALLALAGSWTPPRFPLDGTAVLNAGARPGPAIGAILREVEAWWIDADFTDDELSIIERLKAVTQALG